jgi:helicase SWR1
MVDTASVEARIGHASPPPATNYQNSEDVLEIPVSTQHETADLVSSSFVEQRDSSGSPLSDLADVQMPPDLPSFPEPTSTTDHIDQPDDAIPLQMNGDLTQTTSNLTDNTDNRPSKRRRVNEPSHQNGNIIPRQRAVSPPWKKIGADGPTSFTEGGRRKSGRTNAIPLELQAGDKRMTRRSFSNLKGGPASKPNYTKTNGYQTSPGLASSNSRRPSTASKAPFPKLKTGVKGQRKSAIQETKSRTRARRRSSPTSEDSSEEEDEDDSEEESEASTPPPPPVRRKKVHITPPRPAPVSGTRHSSRITTASTRATEADGSPRITRIKLKVRTPLTAIPFVHPGQAKPRLIPKLPFATFEEYFAHASEIPVEEGGLLVPEDAVPRHTEESARQEVELIRRIEEEAEREGGILTAGRCSAFQPEPQADPPRQWAHYDHLTKAMKGFRRLMQQEQQRHRATAKRIAEACRLEWRRRNPQPRTQEEIEEEARQLALARYKAVLRALTGTWENVRIEINKRRLEEWEAEEQRRVKAALNEAVTISEQKLNARKARFVDENGEELTDTSDNDDEYDEDEDEDEDGAEMDLDVESGDEAAQFGSADEDESNMSSSDDDEDKASVASDAGLTQDQLREKYADLPKLETDPAEDKDDEGAAELADPDEAADETSDESVDMDDDLGSTDMDDSEDDDEGSGSEGDAEDSDVEPSGLLGFFGKSEVKKLQQEATIQEEAEDIVEDTEMADAELPEADPAAADKATGDVLDESQVNDPADEPANPAQSAPAAPNAATSHARETVSASLPNGITPLPTAAVPAIGDAKILETIETDDHVVDIADAPRDTHANDKVPEVVVDAPDAKETSLETDGVTNAPTPSRSQSPRTSVTKPSEVDTASSVELISSRKAEGDTRSPTPQPAVVPKTEIPFLLRGTLREYQHYGLDWLAGLYANKTNGILADEMGLGKTIQTIALLAHLACHHEVWGCHLIIVPTSVMLNWEMEFKKWCPAFKILTYYGNQEERKRKRHGWNNDDLYNVVITSYQMVLQDQQVFKRRKWHYMVLDEAHNIKNFKSQRWQTLLGFNTRARLLLTGTPLQNNLTELWSLLFFLMPPENGQGGFADLGEFQEWFKRPESVILEHGREEMDDESRALITKLHKVLRPYLLRRLKADVEKQMPAKYEHVEFCRLSKRQRELYDGFLARSDTRNTLSSGNYLSIINCLMQLRKVCNHPDLFVDRPIMTSFRMQRSVPGDFLVEEKLVRKSFLTNKAFGDVSLSFLNLIPTEAESMSCATANSIARLGTHRLLSDLREAQKLRAQAAYTTLDPATVQSNIVFLESAARYGRFEELQHAVYLNALRRQKHPIYGKGLVDMLTFETHQRPYKQRPKISSQVLAWFEDESFLLHTMIPTLDQRASSFEVLLTKFACVTPAVVTRDANEIILGPRAVHAFQETDLRLSAPVKFAPYIPATPPPDPWHEARMRLSIQFPDKRLLQWDCGKLQALDRLLRRLQTGGHRALIFTQMTKVLDILEQFLNIHGHKYLRLDGATKVEQRQILTDRFNHDPRILVFILSTRSGGLGINLTGADTVIFYDQDWNPAMDRQCQDRCHRIGQTRDVHIYRLVSEHTIEANILRKAGQKQMLDDVVIQEGEFTTDYFTKQSLEVDKLMDEKLKGHEDDNGDAAVANAAMDRVLGGVEARDQTGGGKEAGRVLEMAEDREDVAAARLAEKEITADDADFSERPTPAPGTASASGAVSREVSTAPGRMGDGLDAVLEDEGAEEVELNADGGRMGTVDKYMLGFMEEALRGTPLEIPKDKKKGKRIRGKDTRKR